MASLFSFGKIIVKNKFSFVSHSLTVTSLYIYLGISIPYLPYYRLGKNTSEINVLWKTQCCPSNKYEFSTVGVRLLRKTFYSSQTRGLLLLISFPNMNLWTRTLNRPRNCIGVSQWLSCKESVGKAGDLRDPGSITGSVRFPWRRHNNHSSVLAWRILWIEEPGGIQSMGSQRVRHEWSSWALRKYIKTYKNA